MANWQTKTIKDTTVLIKDGTHGTHKDVEEGIALLSAKDIDGGKVNVAPDSRVISEADFNAIHARYSLKDGDILLTIVGSLGRVAIVTNYANNYTFQRSVAILRFNNEVATSYAYYYLTSAVFQKELLKRESKGAQGGVYLGDISKIKIHIPEKPEQERIVGVLKVWDEYIEKLEQKIALKEQLKKGLMQQLLTGKRRLPGFTKEWEKRRFADIADVARGKMLTSTSLTQGKYPVVAGGKTSPYSHGDYTHEDVVTVSGSGASAGYVAYHGYKIWASDCSVVEGKNGVSITKYLSLFLKYNQERLYALQSGGAQPHIYPSDIKMLNIELPEISEQEAIVKVLRILDEDIEKLSDKSSSIKLQKKYLLKNLITGTIRTPEDLQPLDTSRLERSAL